MKSDETYRNGIEFTDMLICAVVTFAANYAGSYTSLFLSMMFRNFDKSDPILSVFYFLVPLLTAVLLTGIYFKQSAERQVVDNAGRRSWLNNALWLILPGEILRMIFSAGMGGGGFAYSAGVLYSSLGAVLPIANYFIRYFICHLLTLAVTIPLLLLLYRRVWRKFELENGLRERKH